METKYQVSSSLNIYEATDKMADNVYCLYRVSTTKQVDLDDQKQADIPMQRKACRKLAEQMGWNVIREEQEMVYPDLASVPPTVTNYSL